jgi:hypothetical protein
MFRKPSVQLHQGAARTITFDQPHAQTPLPVFVSSFLRFGSMNFPRIVLLLIRNLLWVHKEERMRANLPFRHRALTEAFQDASHVWNGRIAALIPKRSKGAHRPGAPVYPQKTAWQSSTATPARPSSHDGACILRGRKETPTLTAWAKWGTVSSRHRPSESYLTKPRRCEMFGTKCSRHALAYAPIAGGSAARRAHNDIKQSEGQTQ